MNNQNIKNKNIGRLYIVSTGAGGNRYLTLEALEAIDKSEIIVSYTKYTKELKEFFVGKKIFTFGMTQEIQRCNKAIEYAQNGKIVSIISNGDVNVFAMATLIVELIDELSLWNEIEVISIAGVTSFLAAASKIGAPISQDFAIISLSDRLTKIEIIEKRVKNALEADFVIGIYNPLSRKRKAPYQMFLENLKRHDNKIAIIASNVGREEEKIIVTNSYELIQKDINNEDISMSTLIIIGNKSTRVTKNNLVLTPRGYLNKYTLDGEIE